MTIERETYTELVHSMLWGFVQQQLTLPQVASVLHSVAQQDTTEETVDLTNIVRDALTDWKESDKGQIVAVETVKMTFKCRGNVHGPCEKGEHTVQMTRVIGSMGWEPEEVSSIHDFGQVIMEATVDKHPDGKEGKFVTARHNKRDRGSQADLINAFQRIFDEQGNPGIDQEVRDFRAELDKLFPSAPTQEKGGGDDSP